MKIINTGNIEAAPTRVHLDIYDTNCKDLLESSDDVRFKKVKSFETREIFAGFKTKLEVGAYCGKIEIFKNDEIVKEQNAFFNILERGSSPKVPGRFLGLNFWIWGGIGIIALAGIGYGGYKGYRVWKERESGEAK